MDPEVNSESQLEMEVKKELSCESFRKHYKALILVVLTLCSLFITLYLSIIKQFPVFSPQKIITPQTKRFSVSLYLAAATLNIILFFSRIMANSKLKMSLPREQTHHVAPFRWTSYLVYGTSALYAGYRGYFLLTLSPLFPCQMEVVIIGGTYCGMRASLMCLYAYRLEKIFTNTFMEVSEWWMTAFRVVVWGIYGIITLLIGIFSRGKLHRFRSGEATCFIFRNVGVLIFLHTFDIIVSAVLLVAFLRRLQFVRDFLPSVRKHAFLTIISILSTWIFTMIGSVIGVGIVLYALDVIFNSICVHLMFFENSYAFVWMCRCGVRIFFGDELIEFYEKMAKDKMIGDQERRMRECTSEESD